MRILIVVLLVVILAPLALVVWNSFDVSSAPMFPLREPKLSLQFYRMFFEEGMIARWLFNSVIVTSITAFCATLLSLMAGFGFEHRRFKGSEALFGLSIAALAIPATTLILPQFLLMRAFGLMNSYVGLILPFAAAAGSVLVTRNYYQGYPREYLDEAAVIGLPEWRTFLQVVVPTSSGMFGYLFLTGLVSQWNNFFWHTILIRDEVLYTFPVGINWAVNEFVMRNSGRYNGTGVLAAGAVLAAVPLVLIFVAGRRMLIGGFYGEENE